MEDAPDFSLAVLDMDMRDDTRKGLGGAVRMFPLSEEGEVKAGFRGGLRYGEAFAWRDPSIDDGGGGNNDGLERDGIVIED